MPVSFVTTVIFAFVAFIIRPSYEAVLRNEIVRSFVHVRLSVRLHPWVRLSTSKIPLSMTGCVIIKRGCSALNTIVAVIR